MAVPGAGLAWAVVAFAIGESIDRAEFYEELEAVSPRQQARLDAAGRAESVRRSGSMAA